MRKDNMRSGFGMNYAILVMVLLAFIMSLSLLTGSTTEKTVMDEHIQAQMELYKRSSVEQAILYLSAVDPITSNTNLTYTYGGQYQFQVYLSPLGADDSSPESNGTVRLDLKGEFTMSNIAEPFSITYSQLVKP